MLEKGLSRELETVVHGKKQVEALLREHFGLKGALLRELESLGIFH